LIGILRKTDTLMRLGGDEFVIMLTDLVEPEYMDLIAQRVLLTTRKPFTFHNRQYGITASIGFSIYPDDGEDIETLLKCADIAMYRSKESGRDKFSRYCPGMKTVLLE
jgi:diguanylate cyclase (GGDEF)-like protein